MKLFTDDFADAFCKLCDALQETLEARPSPNHTEGESERALYFGAMTRLALFFDAIGKRGAGEPAVEVGRRFGQLAYILADVNKGIVHPMLRPENQAHGARTDIWRARQAVALALHLYVKSGAKKSEAARWLASQYPDLEKLRIKTKPGTTERGGRLTSAILSWCHQLERRQVKNDFVDFADGAAFLDRLLSDSEERAELREKARRMATWAAQLARAIPAIDT